MATLGILALLFFFFNVSNWSVIALQCCVAFCHTTRWINHVSRACFPPTIIPFLKVITEHWTELPVLHNNFPLAIYFAHVNVYHPQDWKRSVFIPIPKKGNTKECSNYHKIALISHASKVMFKILHDRLQQYVNRELPGVQAGFRKGRGTRDPIANICWIIEKARVPEKHLFLLYWLCQSLWLCGLQ